MAAILVGDVGATGSDWILTDDAGRSLFSLSGYNPVSQPNQVFELLVASLHAQIGDRAVTLYYYGAGIGITPHTDMMIDTFHRDLNAESVSLNSDLLGAARALCGENPGVACILGTGSNACFYDGTSVVNGHSLGYPLGDEGSGMDIGRRIVRAFYYGLMPNHLKQYFLSFLPESRLEFLTEFRKDPAPNRYLGSLIKSLQDVVNEDFIQDIIRLAFTDFINCHLYHIKRSSKINCVGSIAYYFCAEFEKCLNEHQLQLGKVIQRPIEDLAFFHTEK